MLFRVAASYNTPLDEKKRMARSLDNYNRHCGVLCWVALQAYGWWFECEMEITNCPTNQLAIKSWYCFKVIELI